MHTSKPSKNIDPFATLAQRKTVKIRFIQVETNRVASLFLAVVRGT